MLIDIVANKPLQNYYLEDHYGNIINFESGKEFDTLYAWYKLVIEYTGSKLTIEDIKINGSELGSMIYTGWFLEEKSRNKVCPGTTLYTQGQFEIYIHPNVGLIWQTITESIVNNDIGTSLFEKYIHTVDAPVILSTDYPEPVRGFFAHSNAPRWWRKNSIITPYEILDPHVLADISRNKLHDEMIEMCEFNRDSKKWAWPKRGVELKGGRRCYRSSPYINKQHWTELDDLPGEELKKLCKRVGFKRMLAVTLQTQYPGETFAPHVDAHYEQETKMHLQGPCSFVLNLAEDTSEHYFKVSQAGLIPLDHGTFFNFNYCHATWNNSENIRPLAILFGERDNEINWYLNN